VWNRIIGIVGPTGSGKSYTAAKIFGETQRAAVYQIVHEDTNYLGAASDLFDGNIREFCAALGEDNFRYVYRVGPGKRVEKNRFVLPDFEWFIRCCFERKHMMMVIDEAHFLCNPKYIPAYLWESVVTGRHMYLDIVYVTQRLSMVHHDITANTHEFLFWRNTEPGDLERITERCGPDIADSVAMLRKTEDHRRDGGELVPGEMLKWTA
jgi:ABC-type dipeptide/oligopeptide/nickel transport system ATPase component